MNTIQPLGSHAMAGSPECPATFQIRSCPKCYGVLYWSRRGQTEISCENCGAEIVMIRYKGPLGYVKHHIMNNLFSRHTLSLLVWAVLQVLDHRFRLRKILLYAYMRGVSYL